MTNRMEVAAKAEAAARAEAAASVDLAAANRVDATRLIYTSSEEVESFALAGGGNGMRLVLWGCVAALISIMVVSAVFLTMHYQYQSSPRDRGAQNLSDILPVRSSWQQPRQRSYVKSSEEMLSAAGSEPLSGTSGQASSSSRQGPGTPLPGLPLCPLLIVPDGTRLACIVQNDVRRRRQELSFDVGAVPARGGAPLFRVRVSEFGSEAPGIYVETLSGREQLAFLSTEDLWRGSARPVLSISRPWGLPYGTVQKGESGEYLMLRGKSTLLVFSGDFLTHNVQVKNASGNAVARAEGTSSEEYQVHMQARTDAGLVILGLLAIDKCEMSTDPGRKSSDSSSEAAPASR